MSATGACGGEPMGKSTRILRCYSEGKGDQWEAVCLDLDIAVQGKSFQEVYGSLNKAIEDYVHYVVTLPETERDRLLNRTAPLSMRLRFLWYAFLISFRGGQRHRGPQKQRGEFLVACPA
jgi:hypothetical protein